MAECCAGRGVKVRVLHQGGRRGGGCFGGRRGCSGAGAQYLVLCKGREVAGGLSGGPGAEDGVMRHSGVRGGRPGGVGAE